MPSPFDRLAAVADRTVAGVMGEGLRLIARSSADPNGRSGEDVSRPSFTVAGELNLPSTAAKPQGRGIANSNAHGMVRPKPSATLHGALQWFPVKGDRLQVVDTGELFEIAEAHAITHAITRLELVG